MLVSTEPVDLEAVLWEARRITGRAVPSDSTKDIDPIEVMRFIEEEIRLAFGNYEVETLGMLKQ
jgi:hypothetical protein